MPSALNPGGSLPAIRTKSALRYPKIRQNRRKRENLPVPLDKPSGSGYNKDDNHLIKSGGGTGPVKPRQPPCGERCHFLRRFYDRKMRYHESHFMSACLLNRRSFFVQTQAKIKRELVRRTEHMIQKKVLSSMSPPEPLPRSGIPAGSGSMFRVYRRKQIIWQEPFSLPNR